MIDSNWKFERTHIVDQLQRLGLIQSPDGGNKQRDDLMVSAVAGLPTRSK